MRRVRWIGVFSVSLQLLSCGGPPVVGTGRGAEGIGQGAEECGDKEADTDTDVDVDTDSDADYDRDLSLQQNLDNEVSIHDLLERHSVSEFYGLFHAGGYIFHVNEEWGTGLVAHSLDLPEPTHWNDFQNPAPELGLGARIGWGKLNTKKIVGAILGDEEYAAWIADSASINGYDDWFLPSIDELSAVYQNLHVYELGDADGGKSYWSSTSEGMGAWVIYFHNGNTYTPDKTHKDHNVLPVRGF